MGPAAGKTAQNFEFAVACATRATLAKLKSAAMTHAPIGRAGFNWRQLHIGRSWLAQAEKSSGYGPTFKR